MKLFGQLIRTAVNTALLPVAVVADAVTLGGEMNDHGSYTTEAVERLKREAREDDEER